MTMQLRDTSSSELGRYVIGEYLGQGSSSDVFKVVDAATKKDYVLKQISFESLGEEEQRRAKKEILVMNDVDHPNIVKFHESFSGATSVNIVMEYCATTLEELIERQGKEVGQPFPKDVIIEWMAELLSGLAYLHSRRIIHRDIKTSNIFLSETNHAKLGDFGACTVLTSASVAACSMIGTPLYFSPEVCAEETYDERSDVWSLGVVFYEMCTLRHPFEADHLPGLIQQILTKEVAPFSVELDSRFEDIVLKMLSKDPRERPTAQDIIDNHLVVPLSHPSHPSQKPSTSRLIQEYYGPELLVAKKSRTPASSSETQLSAEMQPQPQQGPPQEHRQVRQENNKQQSPGREIQLPAKIAINKAEGAKKEELPKKRVGKETGRELNLEERMEAMKRIKNAKSKIDMAVLRENMRRRRSEIFRELNVAHTDGIPVVVELQGELVSAKVNDVSRTDLAKKPLNSRPNSSFVEDISAVLDSHSRGGARIDLNELEDAVLLLGQYKLDNYGLC